MLTANTQPCIFAVELAAAAAIEAAGVKCDVTAGFSLGEISALTYAGCATLEDGFGLVTVRGQLMQEDAGEYDSGMAAVLKLAPETLEELCRGYEHVYPVNYNCPGQIAVAGLKDELTEFYKDVKAAGGRAIPLKVGGGFHSPFMSRAAEKFGQAVEKAALKQPELTLYSGYTAKPYDRSLPELLSKQICNPVRWQSIVEHMAENGVDTFIELGPGKTLCGLIGKTLSDVRVFNVEDAASLKETVEGVLGC
jgi:[acyl-carrier-protein] S-malonyltransferase